MGDDFEKRFSVTHPVRQVPGPNGQVMFVQDVDFTTIGEPWGQFAVKDGGRIRFRATVTKISRVMQPDGQGGFVQSRQPDGEPLFLVISVNQVAYQDG